jgi:hypothetical protein
MRSLFFLLLTLIIFSGCDGRKREQALELKQTELNQKDQELKLREQSLQLREEELAKRERLLDTTNKNSVDTLSALYPKLAGLWNVTMRCTETTCQGSAVGDIKTEQWDISIQNNTVVAKAMSDKNLLRIYSGTFLGNSFELTAQQENAATQQAAKMIVRLQPTKENEMTGQREILRSHNCRILYALELRKQ